MVMLYIRQSCSNLIDCNVVRITVRFTWVLVFEPIDGCVCLLAIKLTTDGSDDYWILERDYSNDRHVRVYTVNRMNSDALKWSNICNSEKFGNHSNSIVTWKLFISLH